MGPDQGDGPAPAGRDWVAVLIVGLALLVRAIYVFEQRANPFAEYPLMDSLYHLDWARALAAGEDFQPGPFFRAPLYPWLLGTELRFFGEDLLALRLVQVLLGGCTTWLTYLVGRRAFGRGAGRLAALLVATNWVLVYFDGELLIPTLAIPLDLLAIYLTLALGRSAAPRAVAAAGLAWGLAAIARPNVLLFLPLLALWLLFEDRQALGAGLKRAALLAVSVLVPILPLTTYNAVVGGDRVLISSQAGVNLWIGNNPDSDGSTAIVPGTRPGWWDGYHDAVALAEVEEGRRLRPSEVSAHYARKAREFWRDEPASALRLLGWKTRLLLTRHELGNNQDVPFFAAQFSTLQELLPPSWPLLFPLGMIGLWLAARGRRRLLPLWGFVPVYAGSIVLFFVCSRYRAPLLPVLAVLSAHALLLSWRAFRERRTRPLLIGAGAWLGLLLVSSVVPERVDTSAAKGLWQLGAYELEQGRANEALPYLYQSVEANPRFWVARRDLGSALRLTAQPKAAREQWEAALELSPGDLQVTPLLVELLVATGEADAALRVARACVERHPQLAGPRETLAVALVGSGAPDAARAALLAGLRLAPDDFACNLRLGLLERELGDPCAAVEPLARAAASPSAPSEAAREAAHELWSQVRVGCR